MGNCFRLRSHSNEKHDKFHYTLNIDIDNEDLYVPRENRAYQANMNLVTDNFLWPNHGSGFCPELENSPTTSIFSEKRSRHFELIVSSLGADESNPYATISDLITKFENSNNTGVNSNNNIDANLISSSMD